MIATILFVFLFVLFGTKNGRKLFIKLIRKQMASMPISAVRFMNNYTLSTPHLVSKTFLNIITKPIDSEKEWVRYIKKETWEGYWISPKIKSLKRIEESASDQDLVILYLHGGGFALGNALMYLESFQIILNSLQLKNINASILSIDYTLSREAVWPKASNQCFDAYQYIIHDIGVSPSKVIIMGDSAGGNLVCTTLLKIQEYKATSSLNQLPPLSLPAGAILLSPWIDLSVEEYPDYRDILTVKLMNGFISHYIPNFNFLNQQEKQAITKNPLVSPLFGDYQQIQCPFFISYGEYELIKSGIESFITQLKESNKHVHVFYGEKQTHSWFVSSLTSPSTEVYQRDMQVCIQWLIDLISK